MGFDELKELLSKKVPGSDLPQNYGYQLDKDNKVLTMTVLKRGLTSNMQDNEAAFESWAIALKYYLSDIIERVIIDWEEDIVRPQKGYMHYNRFLYRLTKFVQNYYWAEAAKSIPSIPRVIACNVPSKEAAQIINHVVNSEGWLECKYVNDNRDRFDCIDHQFPVGLFDTKVSRNTHFTTGNKSAIDIWSVKDNCLSVYELKIPTNQPLGIISELMFYTNVVSDLMAHRIIFEDSQNTKVAIRRNFRSFDVFYDLYSSQSVERIEAVMLADKLHLLLTPDLIQFINDSGGWGDNNIHFSWEKIDSQCKSKSIAASTK